jgi:hypothetical protein
MTYMGKLYYPWWLDSLADGGRPALLPPKLTPVGTR